MIDIIAILFSGIVIGVLLRGKRFKLLPKIIMVIIYLLLLVMGVWVGANPDVTDNLSTLGVKALIVTLFAIGGSIVAAAIIYRYFFKNRGL